MSNSPQLTGASTWPLSQLWLVLLAALPILTALASFQTDGEFANWQLYARQLWLPTQIFEIATIILALTLGASFWRPLASSSRPVQLLVGLWFTSMIIATAFAKIPNLAIFSLVSWTGHALFLIALMYLLRFWLTDVRWQTRLITWIPLGAACFGFLIVMFVALVGMDSKFDWISALPGFPNIRHMGYFLMPALMLSVGGIATGDSKARNIQTVLLVFNLAFVIWIGSRGPLFGYLATLMIAMLLFGEMRQHHTFKRLLLATLGGCVLSQMVPTPKDPTFNAIMRIDDSKSNDFDQLSSGRTEIWRGTLSAISERPIFGHGGNQFRLLVPAARKNFNQPHNSLLQFIFDWGVIGAGALIALLIILGLRVIAITKEQPLWLPSCLAATSMAIFSLIDGVFYYNLPIILFLTFSLGPLMIATMRANPTATADRSNSAVNVQRYRQRPI